MSRPLVVITDSNLPSDAVEERLLEPAGFEVLRGECRSEEDVVAVAAEADALIVQWAPISAAVITRLERCRFISRLGIGVDMIDLEAATARGIPVANTPEYCLEEVAAHTIALALAASRGLVELERSLRDGAWSVAANTPTVLRPSDAAFLVVGFGRIGRRVARCAETLGYRVLVHDPYAPDGVIAAAGYEPVALENGLARATIVSLHVPLGPETTHLIDASRLALMGPASVLVNTSRGGLIDEAALAAALGSGRIGGAALDVFEEEPLPAASPLRRAPNLLLTPHAAWYSEQALAALPREAAEHVLQFFAGSPPASILNPDYEGASAMPAPAAPQRR